MNAEYKREFLSNILLVALAIIIALVLKTYVFQIALVNQVSMQPTLQEGQVLILSKLHYLLGNPNRGDIVVLKSVSENKLLIKRVIGLPEESLEIKNDAVYINGSQLQPDFTQSPTTSEDLSQIKLPEDKYFVLGDNRMNSKDSRVSSIGLIDRHDIMSKAVFRIWPLNKIGILK